MDFVALHPYFMFRNSKRNVESHITKVHLDKAYTLRRLGRKTSILAKIR